MIDYRNGKTYSKKAIDVNSELIPQAPAYKALPNEKQIFEDRNSYKKMSYFQICTAIETGKITEFDKNVLCVISVFSPACCTSRVLREMLIMMGIEFSISMLGSSVKRLQRYNLVNFSYFIVDGQERDKTRLLTLTTYGFKVAKGFGVIKHYNPFATITAEAYQMKSRAETAHIISNYLKNLNSIIDSFAVRPVIAIDPDNRAIIRPAASITIHGETIYFEVPRRREGWLEDLADKFERYELVFSDKETPTVVINGEDTNMNWEAAKMLAERNFNINFLFTHDLAMFGRGFQYSLYAFNADGTKQYYKFDATMQTA